MGPATAGPFVWAMGNGDWPGMEFTKKWPPEHWRPAFQKSDYKRIDSFRQAVGS